MRSVRERKRMLGFHEDYHPPYRTSLASKISFLCWLVYAIVITACWRVFLKVRSSLARRTRDD